MKRLLLIILSLLMMSVFTACGNEKSDIDEPIKQANSEDKVKIVTSFYPIYIETLNITKGINGVVVENMTKPQIGCLHDYQMTPADMKKLEDADIFVANGAGMEAFLQDIIDNQKQLNVIESAKNIELLKDEHGENAHVWVSVSDCIIQVQTIADELSKLDPDNAAAYQQNAKEYIAKLENLKQQMHKQIDNLPHKDIVTFHEAFPYFAKEFNLNIVDVIEREPGTTPTPSELTGIIEKVNNLQAKALFAEPQYSSTAAKTIANETGAKVYILNPVVTGENDLDAYIKAMKQNALTLQEALK